MFGSSGGQIWGLHVLMVKRYDMSLSLVVSRSECWRHVVSRLRSRLIRGGVRSASRLVGGTFVQRYRSPGRCLIARGIRV